MKKQLSYLIMLFACVYSLSAQHQRRVLVEEFTNASCPPCAAQNPAFNALLIEHHEKVTPIKYQTSWPGVDPMNAQNPTEVQTRVDYYGVTGVPNGFVDGIIIANDCNGYDGAPACLSADEIIERYNTSTPVAMTLSYSLNAAFDEMTINVSVTSDAALSGDIRLHVVVIEDAIYFTTAPGTNGEKEFYNPMRKMLPDADGTATGDFAAGETKTYTFTYPLPTHIYDKNQLGVSAFLQENGTHEVYQSFRAVPPSPGVVVNGGGFVCTSGTSPSVEITNIANAPLTSALIRYRLGNNAWQDLQWTGNLAPGASEQVTLSGIQITQAGNNNVNVLVVESNNGALQTTLNTGYATAAIKALLAAGSALPVGHTFQSGSFPPTGWTALNTGTNGWKLATNAGAGSTRSAKNNMYDYPDVTTDFITPKIDLSTVSGATKLSFDYAYAYFDDIFYDSLSVETSTDCGLTWTVMFHDGYQGLATAPATTATYTPTTAGEWRHLDLDMSSFNGASSVLVRFRAQSGYGNNLYVDNINIALATGIKALELNDFTVAPNPTKDLSEIRFNLGTAQNIQVIVYDALGSLVQNRDLGELVSGDHVVSLSAANLSSGSYRVVLQGTEGMAQTQWVVVK